MTPEQKAAIEEAARLPTARELIAKIIPNRANFDYCGQSGKINGSLLLDIEKAIESHTAAHTAALRDQIADLERENNNYRIVYDSVVKNRDELRERVKELEAWKESASTVLNELDLQSLGQKLGIKLGESISKQLPGKVDELNAQNDRYRKALERLERLTSDNPDYEFINHIAKEALKQQ